jgi:hypothetical protein
VGKLQKVLMLLPIFLGIFCTIMIAIGKGKVLVEIFLGFLCALIIGAFIVTLLREGKEK